MTARVEGPCCQRALANSPDTRAVPLAGPLAVGAVLTGILLIRAPDPFSNEARPAGAGSFNHLVYAHNYTTLEQTAAVSLHEVRLLSVLLGW